MPSRWRLTGSCLESCLRPNHWKTNCLTMASCSPREYWAMENYSTNCWPMENCSTNSMTNSTKSSMTNWTKSWKTSWKTKACSANSGNLTRMTIDKP